MKTNILLFLLAFALQTAFAQSPALINYQAVVRDANGNLITAGTISLGISIHDAIVGGNQLYFETHNGITPNAFGVVNVLIGGGTVVAGNFLMINWGNGNKYLQVYVNSNPIGSRTQMVSVPYALYANKADSSNYATAALTATTATTATNVINAPVIITGWENFLLAQEEAPNATYIGNPIVGFNKRLLNTTKKLVGNAISFDSIYNQITLMQPGTYYIRASSPTRMNNASCQLMVRDVNSSAILIPGPTAMANGSDIVNISTVEGFLTVAVGSPLTFKLDHWFGGAPTSTFGLYSYPNTGTRSIYSVCFVQKIQ